MRELVVAIALVTSLCSTAVAGPKEETLQVLEKWTKAFTDSDVDSREARLRLANRAFPSIGDAELTSRIAYARRAGSGGTVSPSH